MFIVFISFLPHRSPGAWFRGYIAHRERGFAVIFRKSSILSIKAIFFAWTSDFKLGCAAFL